MDADLPDAAAAAPAANPPVFAFYPSQANIAPLDFTVADDFKFFHKGIAALDIKFDMTPSRLQVFLSDVRSHAKLFHWHDIIMVPNEAGTLRNIIDLYGVVTLDEVRVHAASYGNLPTQMARNSLMMYHFLDSLLTAEAKTEIPGGNMEL
jgi:hypothetical protein